MSDPPTNDERLAALNALRDKLLARGVPAQYLHLEALLEIETAMNTADEDLN